MKVGWSAEVKRNEWVKLDLDDSDLLSILVEADFPVDKRHLVPPRLAYQILDNEVQRLLTAKLAVDYDLGKDEAKTRVADLTLKRSALFEQLRTVAIEER